MSRFIADYQSGKPDDFIKFVSEDFFAKEGFRQVNYKGETVWKKGVGFLDRAVLHQFSLLTGKYSPRGVDQIVRRARPRRVLRRGSQKGAQKPR